MSGQEVFQEPDAQKEHALAPADVPQLAVPGQVLQGSGGI